jgi:hypothetical protein
MLGCIVDNSLRFDLRENSRLYGGHFLPDLSRNLFEVFVLKKSLIVACLFENQFEEEILVFNVLSFLLRYIVDWGCVLFISQ